MSEQRTGPVGVGIVGAGMISAAYLDNLTKFADTHVVIVGDLDAQVARTRAAAYDIGEWGTADDVLTHPDVELIVNLTVPAAHAEVSARAVAAGKHVWSEKPISVDRQSGRALLADADAAGVLLGVAPDTVLGAGVQTALQAIARGDIGHPIAGQSVLQYVGPQLFHPNPGFLFAPGAGPLFDIGPYYLTTLVHVFGSVSSVAAVGTRGRDRRTIEVGELAGREFDVAVPTHVSAVLRFTDGGVAQSLFSFDSPLTKMGYVEITGTEGTLVVPDPNTFTGDVLITRAPSYASLKAPPTWERISVPDATVGRGLGVLDLARAARTGETPIASGEIAYHVLDTMVAIDDAVTQGRVVPVDSRVEPPRLAPKDLDPFASTL